jgi:hypothetical protein
MPKIATFAALAAACGVFAILTIEYLVPVWAAQHYREEYKKLVFACDHVMRDHHIAKQLVLTSPSSITISNLEAAEVGLTTCHSYDRLRKQLQRLGVSAATLSEIGLEAIEEKATEIRSFVEIHEIRHQ